MPAVPTAAMTKLGLKFATRGFLWLSQNDHNTPYKSLKLSCESNIFVRSYSLNSIYPILFSLRFHWTRIKEKVRHWMKPRDAKAPTVAKILRKGSWCRCRWSGGQAQGKMGRMRDGTGLNRAKCFQNNPSTMGQVHTSHATNCWLSNSDPLPSGLDTVIFSRSISINMLWRSLLMNLKHGLNAWIRTNLSFSSSCCRACLQETGPEDWTCVPSQPDAWILVSDAFQKDLDGGLFHNRICNRHLMPLLPTHPSTLRLHK